MKNTLNQLISYILGSTNGLKLFNVRFRYSERIRIISSFMESSTIHFIDETFLLSKFYASLLFILTFSPDHFVFWR